MRYVSIHGYLSQPAAHTVHWQVHILNESRGSTLEVVISRMKARGSAVRFVSVSATVPNIDDVARWIGSKHASGPARVFQVCRLILFATLNPNRD